MTPDFHDFDFAALVSVMREPDAEAAPAASGAALPVAGHLFGDYRMEEEIARGGFGIIYRATQLRLDRRVALKVLRDGLMPSSADVERFRREAAAAASLRHRHIVAVHEAGEVDGRHFFSMDYVDGPTLAMRLSSGPLTAREAAVLVRKLAGALAHAHERGVLHRDLKPSNVLIDGEDEPVLTDFGLAWQDPAISGQAGLTMTGQLLGTPAYMAPEQAAGRHHEITTATDVYGLGALLFHCLTGRAPYAGDSAAGIVRQVLEIPPPSVRLLNPAVPADPGTIVEKAMHREPRRRYHTAQAMADDLDRWLTGQPIHARPAPGWEKAWKAMRRHPALTAAAALFFLGAAGIALTSHLGARRLAAANTIANAARDEAAANSRMAQSALYAADMRAAREYYNDGDFDSLDRLLDAHDPAKNPVLSTLGLDPRGFEWRHLRHLSAGDQTRTIPVPGDYEDAALSPDGRYLVYGSMPGQPTRLMEIKDDGTLQPLMQWEENFTRGTALNWRLLPLPGSPGQFLAITDSGVQQLDPATGQRRVLIPHAAFDLAISPDGQWIAAFINRESRAQLVVVRTDTGAEVRSWPQLFTGLEWRPDGKLWAIAIPLVTVSDGSTPPTLDLLDPVRQAAPLESHPLAGLDGIPDHGIIRAEQDLIILDTGFAAFAISHRTRQIMWQFDKRLRTRCLLSPDGARLVLAGYDPRLQVNSTRQGQLRATHRGHRQRIMAHAFCGEEGFVSISGGTDRTIRFWGAGRTGEEKETFASRTAQNLLGSFTALPLSPDGRWAGFISTTGRNTSQKPRGRLWDIHTDTKGPSLPGVPLAISAGGTHVTLLQENAVQRYEPATETLTLLCELPRGWKEWPPCLSADGRYLAVAHSSKQWQVLELPGGRVVRQFESSIPDAPVWHPAEPRFAVSQGSGKLVFYNAATDELTPTRWVTHGTNAWSPDGRQLAASYFQKINLIDTVTLELLKQLPGSSIEIHGLLWTPDARSLIALSARDIHFWNLATSREAMHLPLISDSVAAFITPDSSLLCLTSSKGTQLLRTAPR